MLPCPRRDEAPYNITDPSTDVFEDRAGNPCCSYCGSLEPAEFLKRVKAGQKVIPTDKNYKAYIGDHQKFYFQHLSSEQRQEFVQLMNDRLVNFDVPGYFYVKPFFVKVQYSPRPVQEG